MMDNPNPVIKYFAKGYFVKCHQYHNGGVAAQNMHGIERRGAELYDTTITLFDLHPLMWAMWPIYKYYFNYGYIKIDHWLEIDNPSAVYAGILVSPVKQDIITLPDYIEKFELDILTATEHLATEYCATAIGALKLYRDSLKGN
jgi:hypothetical protein